MVLMTIITGAYKSTYNLGVSHCIYICIQILIGTMVYKSEIVGYILLQCFMKPERNTQTMETQTDGLTTLICMDLFHEVSSLSFHVGNPQISEALWHGWGGV